MRSTTKAVAGFLLVTAGALAQNAGAATVTPAPSCGGDNPCAGQVSAVPTCATSCIESAASNLGCIGHDYSCHCAKYDAIQDSAIGCVLGACGLGEALKVPDAVGSLCSCVTASPTTPCTDEPVSTTNSEPPVITDPPTCGGNPCSDFVLAVPACATGCIESAASEVGCPHGDYSCQCASSRAIQETAILCVVNGCGMQAPDVIGAVGNMCSCVTANPTTPCPESTSTSTIDMTTITTTTTKPKPTPTPACPGNECSFPNPAEHECVAGCVNAVLPQFGCNELEDWNCYCTNFRKITSRAFACAWACTPNVYAAFNTPASQGCTCLLEECPASSSSSVESSSPSSSTTTTTPPEPPTSTAPASTITPSTSCPHPCAPSISAVPPCATACITNAASAVGCTAPSGGGGEGLACQCSSAEAIQASAAGCVVGACGLEGALKVVDAVGALCSCVAALPANTACGTTTPTAGATSSSSGSCSETGTTAGATRTRTGSGEETTSTGESGSGVVTETRTVEVTSLVCDDGDEGSASATATATATVSCVAGCNGGGDGGEDGGDGDDEDGSGSGSSPSRSPSGGPGGGNGGNSGGSSSSSRAGSGSTNTPKPPVETAGSSNLVRAWAGCLAGVVAVAAALV